MGLYHKVLAAVFRLRGPIEMADRLKKSGIKKVTVSDRGGVSVDECYDTVTTLANGVRIEIEAFKKVIDNAAKVAARGTVTTGLTPEDIEFFKKRCPLPKYPFGGESIVDRMEAHMMEQLSFQNSQLQLKIAELNRKDIAWARNMGIAISDIRELTVENKHLSASLDAAYAEIRKLTAVDAMLAENEALKSDLMLAKDNLTIAKATIRILTAKGPNR